MSNRVILWQKWHDPLRKIVDGSKEDDDLNDPDYLEAAASLGKQRKIKQKRKNEFDGPAVVSDEGVIIPLHESNLPSVVYNFWVGHTTFDITENCKLAIKRVPGVEKIKVTDRYRFRIAVGRAFKEDEVKKNIENLFIAKPLVTPINVEFSNLRAILSSKFPFWAIAVYSNGKTDSVGGNSAEEVMNKLSQLSEPVRSVLSWE